MNPQKSINSQKRTGFNTFLHWSVYITSIVLFAFWGTFFVENMGEFNSSAISSIPLQVWLLQAMHLVLLIGYLMIFKWPRAACFVILVSAVLFFAFTAGKNFAVFTLISILPVVLFGISWFQKNTMPLKQKTGS